MIFLYKVFIALYQLGIYLAASWNLKARQWLNGRRYLFQRLEQVFPLSEPVIWIHSASAGEFEQAKPVIENLRRNYPQYKILVTFFSPSGYHVGQKSSFADYVYYLPIDTKNNANKFIKLINPKLVIFVKYDFWYYLLKEVNNNRIPLILISSIFRKSQVFFRWYGSFYLNLLHFFSHIFVQDNNSFDLLKEYKINHCSIGGDTRFDRVTAIADLFKAIPNIETFVGNSKVIVAGSTWPDDEKVIAEIFKKLKGVKLIIAPHEINNDHIKSIEYLFPSACKYSTFQHAAPSHSSSNTSNLKLEIKTNEKIDDLKRLMDSNILIIDNIGMLSRLYNYATLSYIGGGFTKSGIHNSLEAAVYGTPVIFGPNYKKYKEARELIAIGGAFSFTVAPQLEQLINHLLENKIGYEHAGKAAFTYVQENRGATEKIMHYIQENRLLTN